MKKKEVNEKSNDPFVCHNSVITGNTKASATFVKNGR